MNANPQRFSTLMRTELVRINQRSAADSDMVFGQLIHHINEDSLLHNYRRSKGKRACGSDGVSKEQYGEAIEENIADLLERMRQMGYRPQPTRRVFIPKPGQPEAVRPLGISCFEDKLVQMGFKGILEAIYEPLFHNCSYGFRPGRGCHDALKALRHHLFYQPVQQVIDLDISKYFDTIDHELLMGMLEKKISDRRFLRYIRRFLKSGILTEGELKLSEEGVPQGSIVSPVLANIYAHYVIDTWFENTVKPFCRGKVALFRYADDIVICIADKRDTPRILTAMKGRLSRFGLSMHAEKTQCVDFQRDRRIQSGVFSFLGFLFYMGLSKNGMPLPKLKSDGKRIRDKLKRVNEWCKQNRSVGKVRERWKRFCTKLTGHIRYYGITYNSKAIERFVRRAIGIFFKWINRRSQKRSYTWETFMLFQQQYPPPKAKIYHRLY